MKTVYVALIAAATLLSSDKKSLNYSATNNTTIVNEKDDSQTSKAIEHKVMEGAEDLLHEAIFLNHF